MSDSHGAIGENEARELWARAIELQTTGRDADVVSSSAPRAGAMSLDVVLQAAEGAGIHPDSVLLALAERQLVDWDLIRPDDWRVRMLRRFVSNVDAIDVRRRFRAEPERVLAALAEVASRPAFDLGLERAIGPGESVTDRVYVFRRQGMSRSGFSGNMELADVRVLLVTIRATQDGSSVRVRAPLFRRGVNVVLAGVASGTLGAWGTAAGWSLGSALMGAVVGGAFIPATIGAGFLLGSSIGLAGFRSFYHRMVRRGDMALDSFFAAVAAEVEPALVPPPGGRTPQISSGASDADGDADAGADANAAGD